MISDVVLLSRLPVGSSAMRTGGLFTTALATATPPGKGEALGIIETITVATCIVAADAAAKAADVSLLELRLANGLGGKSFVLIEGEVSEVEAAVEAGTKFPQQEGLLVRKVIISQLHEEMKAKIL